MKRESSFSFSVASFRSAESGEIQKESESNGFLQDDKSSTGHADSAIIADGSYFSFSTSSMKEPTPTAPKTLCEVFPGVYLYCPRVEDQRALLQGVSVDVRRWMGDASDNGHRVALFRTGPDALGGESFFKNQVLVFPAQSGSRHCLSQMLDVVSAFTFWSQLDMRDNLVVFEVSPLFNPLCVISCLLSADFSRSPESACGNLDKCMSGFEWTKADMRYLQYVHTLLRGDLTGLTHRPRPVLVKQLLIDSCFCSEKELSIRIKDGNGVVCENQHVVQFFHEETQSIAVQFPQMRSFLFQGDISVVVSSTKFSFEYRFNTGFMDNLTSSVQTCPLNTWDPSTSILPLGSSLFSVQIITVPATNATSSPIVVSPYSLGASAAVFAEKHTVQVNQEQLNQLIVTKSEFDLHAVSVALKVTNNNYLDAATFLYKYFAKSSRHVLFSKLNQPASGDQDDAISVASSCTTTRRSRIISSRRTSFDSTSNPVKPQPLSYRPSPVSSGFQTPAMVGASSPASSAVFFPPDDELRSEVLFPILESPTNAKKISERHSGVAAVIVTTPTPPVVRCSTGIQVEALDERQEISKPDELLTPSSPTVPVSPSLPVPVSPPLPVPVSPALPVPVPVSPPLPVAVSPPLPVGRLSVGKAAPPPIFGAQKTEGDGGTRLNFTPSPPPLSVPLVPVMKAPPPTVPSLPMRKAPPVPAVTAAGGSLFETVADQKGAGGPEQLPLGRKLHWRPLRNVESTIWATMDADEQEADFSVLKSVFDESINSAASKRVSLGLSRPSEGEALVVPPTTTSSTSSRVTLLESKRAQNIGVVVARIPIELVANRLKTLETESLSTEVLDRLKMIVPTEEESKLFWQFKGEESTLRDIEQKVFTLFRTPRLTQRIKFCSMAMQVPQLLAELQGEIGILRNCAIEIRKSDKLKKLLHLVLLLGNYVNHGDGVKKKTRGFSIESLSKLSEFKSTSDPGITTMHFLCAKLLVNPDYTNSAIGDVYCDIPSLRAAVKVSPDSIAQSIVSLKNDPELIKNELKSHRDKYVSESVERMERFLSDIEPKVKNICADWSQCELELIDIRRFFGEDPKKINIEDFFSHLRSFADGIINTVNDMKKRPKRFDAIIEAERALLQVSCANIKSSPPDGTTSSGSTSPTSVAPLREEIEQVPKSIGKKPAILSKLRFL